MAGPPVSYSTVENAARASALAKRQQAILQRISALEERAGHSGAVPDAALPQGHTAISPEPAAPSNGAPVEEAGTLGSREDAESGPLQARLSEELSQRGVVPHVFVRVPPTYYEGAPSTVPRYVADSLPARQQESLDFRRACLGAASVEHLCKSIIMVNTRAPAHISDCSNPAHSKYYLIIVQYAAAINGDKINKVVHQLANSALPEGAAPLGRKGFNLRLCPGNVSDELSGYTHNAVSPVGCRTRIPIIMADRVLKLQPDFFWLGAGQVDLKVGFSSSQFVKAYEPLVADIC